VADVAGPRDYHLGDEAMLEANLETLRRWSPDVAFTVLSRDPSWTRRRYGVDAIETPHFSTSFEAPLARSAPHVLVDAMRSADGLLVSGGGNLCETWPEKIAERVAAIECARDLGLPIVVVGQTLGPRLSAPQSLSVARALAAAAWVGVRERASQAFAASLGLRADRTHLQVDDAFFLEPQAAEDDGGGWSDLRDAPILVTLDGSFGAPARRRTLDAIAAQLDTLAGVMEAPLVFVPHVGGADVPDARADLVAARALGDRLRTPLHVLDVREAREVRALVARSSLVFSTRYHPLVFASAAGIPSLGIYTDDYTRVKLQGALQHAGLERWCVSDETAARGALLPLAVELWHQRCSIRAALEVFREQAERQEPRRWEGICRALRLPHRLTPACVAPKGVIPMTGPSLHVPLERRALTEAQWEAFNRDGYLHVGPVLSDDQLRELRQRIDDIMLGKVRYPSLQMQLDTGGAYEALPDPVTGFIDATLAYRKVQGLESDPLVLDLIRRDVFREVCARAYGRHTSVSIFRAMMMNKPARKGTHLPWHQDAGDVWKLDRDPLITSWIALDPATRANGCVQVIPGTHRLGLLSRNGSTISDAHATLYCPDEAIVHLEVEAGHAVVLHNWMLHRSGINGTDVPRRALSACYMDGRTLSTVGGHRFPIVFGEHEEVEDAMPFLRAMREENGRLAKNAAEAERYALSLVEDNQRREGMRRDAEVYAKSLEAELNRVRAALSQ
jgi:polysaccharide pyruvyl transferase WcaK-like protein